jgi:hypothetical protein
MTDRAFGFVYFSGHGAWIDGVNYIFGKDTNIDFDLEVKEYLKFRSNPSNLSEVPHLFGPQTVEVDYAFKRLNNIVGKGLVFVIDACRNNMVYEELLKRKLTNMTYPRGASTKPRGYVFGFATDDGKKTTDASSPDQPGLFAQALADQLRKQKIEQENSKAVDTFLGMLTGEVSKRSNGSQVPDRAGYLNIPPIFCFEGCKSPRALWPEETSSTLPDKTSSAVAGSVNGRRQLKPVFKLASLGRKQFASLQITAIPKPVALAFHSTQENVLQAPSAGLPAALETEGAKPGKILFELFWCSGDRMEATRKSKAENIRRKLLEMKAAGIAFHNVGVDDAILTKFSPQANFRPGYQRSNSAIMYDSDRNSEVEWGKALREEFVGLKMIPTANTKTPEYMGVFVCDGFDLSIQPALTFIHISDEADRAAAGLIQTELSADIEQLNFQGIQYIADYAGSDEVRYFYPAQKGKAEAIAAVLSSKLNHDVKARRILGYDSRLAGKPVIEIWYSPSAFRTPATAAPIPKNIDTTGN